MKKLPVGPAEIATLLSLTDAWTREEVEAALVRAGWASGDEPVEWAGGAGSPHFFGEEENGWRLELGDEPGAPTSAIRLPCALFWPALDVPDADDDADDYDDEDDFADEDEEDDLDDEYAEVWHRDRDADRDAFDLEFERLSDLLRARLGEPGKRTEGALPVETWHHNGAEVTLEMTDDINSYSHYDVIAVLLRPA